LRKPSLPEGLEPKTLILRAMFSLVCESNVGFSMRQLTKMVMLFLICAGLA